MYCKVCGENLKPDAKFCENCGTKVKKETDAIPKTDIKKSTEPVKPIYSVYGGDESFF